MAYTSINFPTKKALKEAVAAGQKITVWSPGPFPVPANGLVVIEGPQYPKPHKFYASAEVVNGYITKVK
jgi:SRSO17 transposase